MGFPGGVQRAMGALVVVGLALAAAVTPAAGDPIEDKQEQARRIAARVDELGIEIGQLAEEYNAARIHLAEVQGQIADAQARVAASQAERAERQAELRAYAVQAYVDGGETETLPALLGSEDGADLGLRRGYLRITAGNRQELIDRLADSEEDLEIQLDQLGQAQAEAEALSATIAERKEQADRAVAEQHGLLNQTESELNALVQEEQQRQAAAAAAEAQRRAEQAAAQQAAAEANRPPSRSGGSGPRPAPDPGPDPEPDPAPPTQGGVDAVIAEAYRLIGTPYVWGGSTPSSGFDCSGFTAWVWKTGAGVYLPHNSGMQYSATTHMSMSQIQPGDLIFYGSPLHHVALYVGGGKIIHAPNSSSSVRIDSVYYWDSLVGAGRV